MEKKKAAAAAKGAEVGQKLHKQTGKREVAGNKVKP